MRRKPNILVIAIPVIIVTMIILFQLGLFKNLTTNKVVPIEGPGKTASNTPYSCPLSASECQVSGTMNCDTSTGTKKVVFRASSIEWSQNPDFALSISGGSLQSFTFNTQISNSNCGVSNNYLFSNNGAEIHYSSTDGVYICYVRSSSVLARSYKLGGSADISSLALNPTMEIYSSDSGYICNGEFKIFSSSGVVKKTETLSYNNPSIKGYKTSSTLTISPGDKASVTGGSSNYVSYNSYFVTECDFDYCSSNSIFKCDNGRKTSVSTPCGLGYICTGGINANAVCVKQAVCSGTSNCNDLATGYNDCNNGQTGNFHLCNTDAGEVCKSVNSVAQCIPPFKILSINPSKQGFTKEEGALIYVEAVSTDSRTDITSGFVRIYLSDKPDFSVIKGTYDINPFDFKANIRKEKQITGLDYGTYYVKMDLNYNGKVLKVPEVKSFKVNPKMVLSLDVKSGTEGLSSLFVNSPVLIEVFTSDSSKTTPVDPEFITLTVKLNGYEVSGLQKKTKRISGSSIITPYEFTPLTKGNLEVIASASLGGVQSNTETITREVKDLRIEVNAPTFLGISCAKIGDTKTFTFETKVLDEYVDAVNKLEVIEPTLSYYKDITGTITPTATGRYSFNYAFTKKGIYKFRLVSTSSKYNIGSEPILPQINVQDTCEVTTKECTVTEDCDDKYGLGYRCIDGKCVKKDDPLILYLIIVGVAIVLVIVVVVILVSRRKRSDVNLGGLDL